MAQASAEKLQHNQTAEKKRVASGPHKHATTALSKTKGNRAAFPEYHIMRCEKVKVGESRTFASERGISAGSMER